MTNNSGSKNSTQPKLTSDFVGLVILHHIDRYIALGVHYDTPFLRGLLHLYLIQRQQEVQQFQRAALYSYALGTLQAKVKACCRLAEKSPLADKRLLLTQAERYGAAAERVHAKFQQVLNAG